MADATTDDKLREMAEHRGLKLVKSRKRKPGSGDYGKFGLTDMGGKALLGIGDGGLTASADDIEAYLRAGAISTWKASADATPARVRPAAEERVTEKRDLPLPSVKSRRAIKAVERKPKPLPKAEPRLLIRAGKPSDAAMLALLLRQLARVEIDERAIAGNFEAARRAKGGLVVAERGMLVGCCAWAIFPTIQHGLLGRLTLLLVHEKHRRRGIATAMLDAAVSALRKAGCSRLEAMSDIDIANAHGFFRTRGFEQTSYRFARSIAGSE